MGCNIHMAVSYVIGRRGQGFIERKARYKTGKDALLNISEYKITF